MVIFRDMRITRTCLLVVTGCTLAALPLAAVNRVVKPTDYYAIEKRNPFGLVDPPKPQVIVAPVEPVAKEPPPNVELTGMYHDSVRKKTYALFMVDVKGESKKRSYMLSEGENQEGLKVVEIDRESSNVKISMRGQESTITFSKPKAAEVPNRRVPPGPGAVVAGRRQVQPVPSPGRVDVPDVQQFRTGGRTGTFSGSGRSGSAVAGGMSPVQPDNISGSLRSIPTRQMRTQQQPMTRQEQEIIIEAQRKVNEIQRQQNPGGAPPMPPLPPTSMTTPEDFQRIVVPPSIPGGN